VKTPRALFYAQVYDLVRRVPRGKVTTYGSIAAALGSPLAARQVGWALAALVYEDEHNVPAHRVVNRLGGQTGGRAFGWPEEQRARLAAEGIQLLPDGRVPLERYLWEP
jgi:methylated-DNA-protein-cysteine methyltransferase related protein